MLGPPRAPGAPRGEGRVHDERRKHHRVTVTLAVDVTTSAEGGTNFFAGATRDLSLGGIFIDTRVSVPPGELVHVDLSIEGRHHSLPCEVVWELRDASGQTVGFGARFLVADRADPREFGEVHR
jgi:hypothetical protein